MKWRELGAERGMITKLDYCQYCRWFSAVAYYIEMFGYINTGRVNIRIHRDITGEMWFGVGEGMRVKSSRGNYYSILLRDRYPLFVHAPPNIISVDVISAHPSLNVVSTSSETLTIFISLPSSLTTTGGISLSLFS